MKKSLAVLIQHNLVSFEQNKRGFVEYTANTQNALLYMRFPRYVYSAKTLYGDEAELIVEELLQHGQLTMSLVLTKVTYRLRNTETQGWYLMYMIKLVMIQT